MATIPSLALIPSGYKASKVYSVLPTDGTGDFDFTRSGNATRVNSDGLIELVSTNVPRLNYPLIDGVVNGCPSLLLEPQRINLLPYSEAFDNAYWNKTNSSVVSGFVSPNGTTNAFKLVEDTSTGIHILQPTTPITTVIGTSYSLSAFYKIGERPYAIIGLHYNSSNGCIAEYEFSTDTFVYLGAAGANYSISNLKSIILANGFVKLSCTVTTGHTVAFPSFGIHKDLLTSGIIGNNVYTGDGTSGVYIWGAQVELGSYATSYIPTQGASATRVGEVCSQTPPVGIIGQTEGTIFADFEIQTTGQDMVIMNISNLSTPTNGIYFYLTSPNQLAAYVDNGGQQVLITSGVLAQGKYKAAFGYKANDFAFYLNGNLVGVDNSGNVPTCSVFQLDNYTAAPTYQEKTEIAEAKLYNTRLSNSELQALTS